MNKIKEQFEELSKSKPLWSDFICFIHILRRNKKLVNRDEIRILFKALVNPREYPKTNREKLLEYIFEQAEA